MVVTSVGFFQNITTRPRDESQRDNFPKINRKSDTEAISLIQDSDNLLPRTALFQGHSGHFRQDQNDKVRVDSQSYWVKDEDNDMEPFF
jgi:hypothetical protein